MIHQRTQPPDTALRLGWGAVAIATTAVAHAVIQAFMHWPMGLLNLHLCSTLAFIVIAALREHSDRNTRKIQGSVQDERAGVLTDDIANLERRLREG